VIFFHALTKENLAAIVEIQLRNLEKLLASQRIAPRSTQAAREWLAEQGFSLDFGARPLKRLIQKRVQNPLAEGLLRGDFTRGDAILIDVEGDNLVLRRDEEKGEEATAG
jgi:ATP-dependent Clp protease ATP-binding subunit ClpB